VLKETAEVAWLDFDNAAERYRVGFRFDGRQYRRSLKTSDAREARALLGRIEETILLIERGRLELPPDVDPATYILSDGKRTGEEKRRERLTVKQLIDRYQAELPPGAKEESTLEGERIHFKHLLRHFRGSNIAQSLSVVDVQDYVAKRMKDRWRGKYIGSQTVKKELTTLRLVWNWAAERGYVTGPSPVRGIQYPKSDEKQIFRTAKEIELIVRRGGLSDDEEAELWEGLYLTREETAVLLTLVEATARYPFVFPLFVFAAHTGARRSEILRARIDDFDFQSRTVQIREKKKSRSHSITYRRVDMTQRLMQTMKSWFGDHPGGQFAIAGEGKQPLTRDQAHDHFKRAIKGSSWEGRIRGFHTFRHSFCSNLASVGVDQRVIDSFVGHTTEAMRKRYQHLAPSVTQRAIELLAT
jgi:integrase